jgi:hypothetical protein
MIKLKTTVTDSGRKKRPDRFEPWLYMQSPVSKFAITVDCDVVTVECVTLAAWSGMDGPTVIREFEDFQYRAGCIIDRNNAVHDAIAFCALYQTKIFETICDPAHG